MRHELLSHFTAQLFAMSHQFSDSPRITLHTLRFIMPAEILIEFDKTRFEKARAGDVQQRMDLLRACHAPCWHFVSFVLLPRANSVIPFAQSQYKFTQDATISAHKTAMESVARRINEFNYTGGDFNRQLTRWVRSLSDDAAFMQLIEALNSRSRNPGDKRSEWALERLRQMAADWFNRRCDNELVEDMVNEWTIRVIRYFDSQPFVVERGSGSISANFQAFLF